ncbi:glycosyltransferase, partial [Methylovulum sp.]
MKRIVIMAGGTGGHVFPALAVAQSLQEKGWQVSWLGTQKGLESRVV